MTDLEKRAIRLLLDVKVPDKNWHGARIKSLSLRMACQPESRLPLSETSDLWFLVWRYRGQIDDNEIVNKANELVNGALSLAF
jgi:hypothetical protein